MARLLQFCLFLPFVFPASATVHFVNPDGTGTHPTIQAAIDPMHT